MSTIENDNNGEDEQRRVIHRVVSTFIILSKSKHNKNDDTTFGENIRVAVFHRVATMPTFPNHFAACSGTIEAGETPWQAACREVEEEVSLPATTAAAAAATSLSARIDPMHGLYLDVPYKQDRIIRVYPFQLQLEDADNHETPDLQLKGSEHDSVQFVTISQLETLQPSVPGLARAFHHATHGKYLASSLYPSSSKVREWASDTVNGAGTVARNAVQLLLEQERKDPSSVSRMAADMKMMRPSMVVITNILQAIQDRQLTPAQALEQLQKSSEQTVEATLQLLSEIITSISIQRQQNKTHSNNHEKLVIRIATFSRSSTIVAVLKRLVAVMTNGRWMEGRQPMGVEILCAKSTPGNEGQIMAEQDLCDLDCPVSVLEDSQLETMIQQQSIDILLLGCDCVMMMMMTNDWIVNKVGTARLAKAARDNSVTVVCCADPWKVWNDIYPPPLEDIFELVPIALVKPHLVLA